MSEYKLYCSQLQSRIARRANSITELNQWKHVHRAMEQMKDWRDTKKALQDLSHNQTLDKRLLKVMQELAYCDDMMSDRGSFVKFLCEAD